MEDVDCVVAGAGVVGLAVARALALAGREVLVLEARHTVGTQTSSRSSEVIHAGIYYPTGSLKARLCVRGKTLLYEYCGQRGIDHRRCGKLIVATTDAQIGELHRLRAQALDNQVDDLVLLDAAAALALEPALACTAALLSPSTGIVDSHALMLSLWGDLERLGGILVPNTTVASAHIAGTAIEIIASDGTALRARMLVNAAGHGAVPLARRIAGLAPRQVPGAWFAKGSYFSLSQRAPFSRLVYPVPEPGGLGVHLTLDLGGQARLGPNVEWVDSSEDVQVDPRRGDAFYREVRRYWPGLNDGALQPAYAGVRPKIHGPGQSAPDFLVQGPAEHGVPGLINLFGIESPGLTSALALGEHVVVLVQ